MNCLNFIATFNEKIKGFVKFHQCSIDKEVLVLFNLYGFKPNTSHAIHIHEYGNMTNGCESLGGHLNLTNNDHGSIDININDSHTGDLINNLKSDVNGRFKFIYTDPRLQLFGNVKNSIIGTSIVIHSGIDDLGLGNNKESKINGNAGGRIACSIIGKDKNGNLSFKLKRIKKYKKIKTFRNKDGGDQNKKRKFEDLELPTFNYDPIVLNESLIELAYNFLNLDSEVCGIIEKESDKTIFKIYSQDSEISKDKSMCLHGKYAPYIFHTHPNTSKSYPSASDIIKVIKHNTIKSSLIFTRWGIWEIYSNMKKKISIEMQEDMKNKINTVFETLYFKTEKGRAKTVDYIFIDKFLNDFKSEFDINILLTPWKNEYIILN